MQMSVDGWRLESLGEDAVLLRLGGLADAALNRRVHALAGRIAAARPAWLCDIVPAYASLALFVDPAQTGDRYAQDLVGDWLAALPDGGRVAGPQEAPALEIPVCYHPSCAPDLEAVARRAGRLGLSVIPTARTLTATTSRVTATNWSARSLPGSSGATSGPSRRGWSAGGVQSSVGAAEPGRYQAVQPPSTTRLVPLTKLDAADARKTTGPLISGACAIRPITLIETEGFRCTLSLALVETPATA